jgi:hypothetical protein
MDIKLTEDYDIEMDFNNGNFKLTQTELTNQINVALLTNFYDLDYDLGLKQGGFINQDIGNNIWLITLQNSISAITRAEIKEEVRTALFDYGEVEFSIINKQDVTIYLKLNNNQQIIRSYRLV